MAGTIFKLGWTNPLTDVFGAHPVLGPVLDLDDGIAFTLAAPGVELPPPPRTLVTAGNVRIQGERATRAVYRHNRQVVAHVLAGPMASYADLTTNVRVLVSWLAGPPSIPFTIQYQPPGAVAPIYIDVVGAAHDIPADESQWLRLQLEPVELIFVARPGLRGDRVTLQNLVPNPGFLRRHNHAPPPYGHPHGCRKEAISTSTRRWGRTIAARSKGTCGHAAQQLFWLPDRVGGGYKLSMSRTAAGWAGFAYQSALRNEGVGVEGKRLTAAVRVRGRRR